MAINSKWQSWALISGNLRCLHTIRSCSKLAAFTDCSRPDFLLHFCFFLGPQEHSSIFQIFLLNNFGRKFSHLADRRDPESPQNFLGVVMQPGGPQQPWFPENSSLFIPPWIRSMVFFFLNFLKQS